MPTTYAIPNGSTAFAATTYTGNGSTQSISNAVNGTSFQPDLVWVKDRTAANQNVLFDSIRGATKYLVSNTTGAEGTVSGVTAFNSNGFGVGSDPSTGTNGNAYVGWQWKAGGAAVTNTSGSITSQVSANPTAGFSVVTWTGTGGSAQTIGHGLGVAPSMIIMKSRNNVSGWNTYHASVGNTGALNLQTTAATSTSIDWWNNTSPTSSVWTIGANINISTWTWVAYCFAAVPGYSAFGSYTGNGSSDGPFVYLGFRPRWVMIKSSSAAGNNWIVYDTSRNTYNLTNLSLVPDSNAAENGVSLTTENTLDILSNGFKLRTSNALTNGSSVTYIYACFAEMPFKYANGR